MAEQLSLLDTMLGPSAEAIRRAVDADGPVIQSEVDWVFELPSRYAWPTARIELHEDEAGYWMWAVQVQVSTIGSGYRVGPKWGRFAVTRFDALFYACQELDEKARHITERGGAPAETEAILVWLARLLDRAGCRKLFEDAPHA